MASQMLQMACALVLTLLVLFDAVHLAYILALSFPAGSCPQTRARWDIPEDRITAILERSGEQVVDGNGGIRMRQRRNRFTGPVDGDGPVAVVGRVAVNFHTLGSSRASGPKTPASTARSYSARFQW